jgi:hypothetical protein
MRTPEAGNVHTQDAIMLIAAYSPEVLALHVNLPLLKHFLDL